MRVLIALAVVVIGAATPPGAAAMKGDPAGYRLSGKYKVRYSRKSYGRPTWRLTPRCPKAACNTKVLSKYKGKPTGLRTVFRFRSSGQYVAKNRYHSSNYGCTVTNTATGEQVRIPDAYVQNSTFRIKHFAGARKGRTAKYARGHVLDIYRPTQRAKAQGCSDPFRRSAEFYLRRR